MTQKEKQQEGLGNKSRFLLIHVKQVGLLARLFLFCLGGCFSLRAQPHDINFSASQLDAYNLICEYRLQEAESIISKLGESSEKTYILNLRDFLFLSISESKVSYEKYVDAVEVRENLFSQLPDNSPQRHFYLADFRLQQALLSIRFGNNFSGLYKLLQAKEAAAQVRTLDQNFTPVLKIFGIINVLLGLVPENYRWWLSVIGLEGNIEKGLGELKKLEQSDSPISSEATLLLGFVYSYPLPNPALAVDFFTKARHASSDHRLATFMLSTNYSKSHQADSALIVLESNSTEDWNGLPQALYLRGDLMLQKGQTEQARAAYLSFLDRHPGTSFKKDASTKIAISFLFDNNRPLFEKWIELALATGSSSSEPDKNAESLLAELNEYPLSLLKSRFLADGGYLEAAQAELSHIVSPTGLVPRWQSEYYYRQARIFHFRKEYAQALSFYQQADELAEGQPWYIGASAALQAGLILKEMGLKKEAVTYFSKAKKYPEHPYKQSIDSNAEWELELLGKQ